MSKYFVLKRPEPRFFGKLNIAKDVATNRILEQVPDMSSGQYISVWATYEMALHSLTKGNELLAVLALRKKLQDAIDPEDARFDATMILITDTELRMLVAAVQTFDWTMPTQTGSAGTQFYTGWMELFESLLDADSPKYGVSPYDIQRPTEEYLESVRVFDERKVGVAARYEESQARYAAAKAEMEKNAAINDGADLESATLSQGAPVPDSEATA